MKRAFTPLALLAVVAYGCRDERKLAVSSVLAFAQSAPYSINPNAIIVNDSALPEYNQVFAYLEQSESTRLRLYEETPGQLLLYFPVTRVLSASHQASSDTLLSTIIFEKPLNFSERLRSAGQSWDTLPLNEQRERLAEFLRRSRAELQEQDTALFTTVRGPKITRMVTRQWIRDSVVAESTYAAVRSSLQHLAQNATFRRIEFADYSRLGRYGGSLKGYVYPNDATWPSESGGLAYVECEGSTATDTTTVTAYVGYGTRNTSLRDEFLCFWADGSEAADWQRVRPQSIRVRLLGVTGRDTSYGSWTTLWSRTLRRPAWK